MTLKERGREPFRGPCRRIFLPCHRLADSISSMPFNGVFQVGKLDSRREYNSAVRVTAPSGAPIVAVTYPVAWPRFAWDLHHAACINDRPLWASPPWPFSGPGGGLVHMGQTDVNDFLFASFSLWTTSSPEDGELKFSGRFASVLWPAGFLNRPAWEEFPPSLSLDRKQQASTVRMTSDRSIGVQGHPLFSHKLEALRAFQPGKQQKDTL